MTSRILEGRLSVVTGGESGIGAASVAALAAAGANVAVLYHRDSAKADRSCSAARTLGARTASVKTDVGVEKDVEEAFDAVNDQLGLPDILVNSAGVNMSETPVTQMTLDQWNRRIRTDLTGCFLTSRRFARDLVAQQRPGSIINISSIHSTVMRPGAAAYDAAKGGLRNLTQTMALETAEAGITVNAIAPGMILTPMNQQALDDEEYRREKEKNIPMRRAGGPDEVAQIVVFLASPAAAYMTGSTITVDGGLSLLLGQGA